MECNSLQIRQNPYRFEASVKIFPQSIHIKNFCNPEQQTSQNFM